MTHNISLQDQQYLRSFERCEIDPETFNHREHIQLTYILLSQYSLDQAAKKLKSDLLAFLEHIGVDPGKYHATRTRAWLLAVKHFMHQFASVNSAKQFICANPRSLDQCIMSTHYLDKHLNSAQARSRFVLPD